MDGVKKTTANLVNFDMSIEEANNGGISHGILIGKIDLQYASKDIIDRKYFVDTIPDGILVEYEMRKDYSFVYYNLKYITYNCKMNIRETIPQLIHVEIEETTKIIMPKLTTCNPVIQFLDI